MVRDKIKVKAKKKLSLFSIRRLRVVGPKVTISFSETDNSDELVKLSLVFYTNFCIAYAVLLLFIRNNCNNPGNSVRGDFLVLVNG